MKNFLKNFIIVFVFLFLIAGVLGYVRSTKSKGPETVSISKMIEQIQAGQVKTVIIKGDTLSLQLQDENARLQEVQKEPASTFDEIVKNYGVPSETLAKLSVEVKNDTSWKFWVGNLLPILLPLIIFILFFYFMTRGVQGMNNKAMGFGQSNPRQTHPDDKNKKTFADVAGAKEAKQELVEVVDFLKDPKKFTEIGAKIPKGVLLVGSPGTGKTLLAKAVAGEANVPFFNMSGSEFVEMFVGVGASRVRDLFGKAKKDAPAIVFIDEIDAVGRRRGAGLGGGHDEREQTLNQILVEMDGFEPNLGVIIMAATNRPDVLDPALLRPGRFDRRVMLDLPDIKDREEILGIHARNKPLEDGVFMRKIAERTPGFSGADLANLLNEAAILAVRRGKKKVGEIEILESIEKVLLGPERKNRIISDHEKKMTAYHEAGHAIVGHYLPNGDPVRKVSVISRGSAGGYTLKMPTEDKHYHTVAQFKDELAMMMGGYVVEKLIFGDEMLSTGPSSDLTSATKVARNMVVRYGMSGMGPRTFGEAQETVYMGREISEQREYSEKTAEAIDREVTTLLAEAEKRAKEVVESHRPQMEDLVKELMEKETVEQEGVERILGARK